MSRAFRAEMVIRCPLCHDWREPAHVGNSVMVCEGCGQTYRVVYATPGNTGKKLGAMIRQSVRWR